MKTLWRKVRPHGGLTRFLLTVSVIGAFGIPLAAGFAGHAGVLGSARADGFLGGPVITGKISPNGNFIELVVPEFGGYTPLSDGDTLFGNTINIYVFATHPYNSSIGISYGQGIAGTNRTAYQNTTMQLSALTLNQYTISVPSTIPQVDAVLIVDGAQFHFYHLTPLTLLPQGILTVGGLDFVIIAILAETVVMIVPMTLLAKVLVSRAIYAPKFNIVVWGHVVIIGLVTLVVSDYRFLDQTFGGVSYFVYPLVGAMMIFLWELHLFNRSKVVEILKPDTMSGHRLRYLRWTQLIGELKDGRTVLIDPRWRGFLYGLLGHFATLIPVESEATIEGRPFGAEIQNRRTMPRSVFERKLRRARPGKEKPTDDFEVINSEKEAEPVRLYWVDSDQPVDVAFPHLSFYRWVDVPRKVARNGTVIEAHRERKLSWPHIIDPTSNIRLAGIHYADAPVAALGWSRAEDDFRLLEKRAYQVYLLRSRFESEADRMTEERLAEFLMLWEESQRPLSDEEARLETDRSRYGEKRDPRPWLGRREDDYADDYRPSENTEGEDRRGRKRRFMLKE